jgi:vanillate O-demethylase ferredoxin subunit
MVTHDEVRNRYRIGVKLEEKSRGGSKAMHQLKVGQVLKIGHPRNNFMLYENARRSILIAGGIGITPMLAMAHRLIRVNRDFELHVCARNEEMVPFKKELAVSRLAKHVHIHVDQENGRSGMSPDKVLLRPDPDSLVYICGPGGFMNWVRDSAIARGWPAENVRIESFGAPIAEDVSSIIRSPCTWPSRTRTFR